MSIGPELRKASDHIRKATDLVRAQIPEHYPVGDIGALAGVVQQLLDADSKIWRCVGKPASEITERP